ncbi:MAG TPA: helix-turn-helix domain-containing protein [Candidatus Gemmiger faecigallinarum]|nr:helix-turn-helix domain-containing protein [Candidatus Gemmiger faecigallinarum]
MRQKPAVFGQNKGGNGVSEFSTMLNGYIHQKGYSVRALARRLGISAATLTKLCNGTRSPRNQRENVTRICNALMLTPAQRDALNDALEREIIGGEVYASRMSMKALIEGMAGASLQETRVVTNTALPPQVMADKRADVYTILRAFLENGADGHTLELVLPPSDPVVIEAIGRVVKTRAVTVRHIIAMAASDSATGRIDSRNIDCIQRIQPLLLGKGTKNDSYQPFYYYDHAVGPPDNLLQFPNVLISDKGVMICSADYSRAIYSSSRPLQKYYHRLFVHQLASCRPLVTTCHSVLVQMARYNRMMEAGNGESFLTLSWQPCLMWAVTDQECCHFLPEELPFREEYLKVYLPYLGRLRRLEHITLYFSLEGLQAFVRDGVMRELPDGILKEPLPVPFRAQLLQRLLTGAESGRVVPHIVRDEKLRIGQDAQLLSCGADTIMLAILNHTLDNSICFVEELSANWSALDFLETLENSDWLYSVQETCAMIRELVDACQTPYNAFHLPARPAAQAAPRWITDEA